MSYRTIKTRIFAGTVAFGMLFPNMTALAATTATDAVPSIEKNVTVAREITVSTTGDNEIKFELSQFDCDSSTAVFENGDGIVQPTLSGGPWTYSVDVLSSVDNKYATYEKNGNNQAGSVALSGFVGNGWENGEYTFKISEISPADKGDAKYGWTKDKSELYLHVYISGSGGNRTVKYLVTNSVSVTGGDTSKAYSGKLDSISFTNVYTKRAGSGTDGSDTTTPSLTLRKEVDGDSAGFEPAGTTYVFTIKLKDSNTVVTKGQTYSYKIIAADGVTVVPDENGNEIRYATVPDNRNITVTLEKNQTAVFDDIPAGVECKIEEDVKNLVNISGYKNIVTTAGKTATSQNNDKDTDAFPLSETANNVVFVNTYKNVTATGIVADYAPFIALVALSAIGIAAYVVLVRRLKK